MLVKEPLEYHIINFLNKEFKKMKEICKIQVSRFKIQ